jgi:hypothetical protein
MFTEDYFKRQINQAMSVLLAVLGLKKSGQYEDAHQTIEQALAELFAMRKDLSDRLDDDSLLNILIVEDELDLERLAVIADLYYLDGEILAEIGQSPPAALANLRALRFYLELALADFDNLSPELSAKIADLQKKLVNYTLPQETQLALDEYTAALRENSDANPG